MAKKKKNKLIPLICMALAVAAIVGAYFYIESLDLNNENSGSDGTTTDDSSDGSTVVAIQSKSTDDLVSMTFNDKNGNPITFVKEEGVWHVEDDKVFPVDQTAVNDITSTLGTLLASRTIDEDTGEFGFDNPKNVFSATYDEEDGKVTVKYTVGDKNEFNSGTYIRDDISGKIYICSSDPSANFEVLKEDLIELDVAAFDVEPTSTHTVTIVGTDGRKNVITDNDGIDEFLGDPFGNADCSDWVEYDCDEADMAKYGITKTEDKASIMLNYKTTVSVTDENGESTPKRQEATYHIWFGDTLDDGSVYYTITDSTFVYKLSKDDFDLAMSYLDYVPAPETEETTETSGTEA